MDLRSILEQAGGTSAIAQQLGVDEATVEQGAGALLPHVVNGVETRGVGQDQLEPQGATGDQPGGVLSGLGGLLGGLLGGGGSSAGAVPAGGLGGLAGGGGAGGILGSLVGGGIGNQILGHIFGSKDASRDVATQASQQSGVDTSVLKKLLPILAGAVAMHFITHRAR